MYNLFGRSSFLFLLSVVFTFLNASSFSEFKKSQSDFVTMYADEKDKVFNEYLLSNWEEYFSFRAAPFYTKAKLNKISSAKKLELKARGPIVYIATKKQIIKMSQDINQTLVLKSERLKEIDMKKDIEFDFFGENIALSIPTGIRDAKFYPLSKKGISNFFNVVVSTEYEILLDKINKYSLEYSLNDWGKYMLIKKISNTIFTNQDDSRLLRWFIFNKLGYSVKLGLSKKHIVVLYESKKTIYNTPIYEINKKNFYSISQYAKGSNKQLFTYKQSYPGATRNIDLSMDYLPNFYKDIQTKVLTFKVNMKKYTIKYRYNKNIIDFMATYPQVDYTTYFNAPLEEQSYQDIVYGLREYINGKKSSYAINFVLHFVQNAFVYELDSVQFLREKVMFAQETLYYKKSDSEDRVVLFAKLVRDMFKIGVVGVKYTNYMVAALYIPLDGDSVKVGSKKYVIADPTYVNASIGQGMIQYRLKRPEKFIFLKNKRIGSE